MCPWFALLNFFSSSKNEKMKREKCHKPWTNCHAYATLHFRFPIRHSTLEIIVAIDKCQLVENKTKILNIIYICELNAHIYLERGFCIRCDGRTWQCVTSFCRFCPFTLIISSFTSWSANNLCIQFLVDRFRFSIQLTHVFPTFAA